MKSDDIQDAKLTRELCILSCAEFALTPPPNEHHRPRVGGELTYKLAATTSPPLPAPGPADLASVEE